MNYLKKAFIISFIFLSLLSINTYSQELEASIKVDRTNIYFGESIRLELNVKNADKNVETELNNVKKDFMVTFLGDNSVNQSYMQIINGEVYKQEFYGHKFSYEIQPKRGGNFIIGPIKVIYKGKTAFSNKISVKVVAPSVTDLCFIEIESKFKNYIRGEKFKIILKIYLKRLEGKYNEIEPIFPNSPPALKIPWLEGIKGLKGKKISEIFGAYIARHGASGFYINNMATQQSNLFSFFDDHVRAKFKLPKDFIKRKSPLGNICSYICYKLEFEYIAKDTGKYVFGPVLLKGALATKVISEYDAESKKVVVSGSPITINIQEPPLINQPEIYSGAIGNFSIQAKISPKKAYVGDPMTLIIEVKGEGDLQNIKTLKLAQQKKLVKLFKIYEDAVATEIKKDCKIFRYTIRPKLANAKKFPSLKFCYFNIKDRKYKVINTKEIDIDIKPVKIEYAETEKNIQKNKKQGSLAKETEKGIFANYKNINALEHMEFGWKLWEKIFVIAMPFIYMVLFLILKYKREIGDDIVFQRKKIALKKAVKKIKNSDSSSPRKFYSDLASALIIQFADYLNLNGETLVIKEVEEHLKKINIEQNVIEKTVNFLYFCEDIQYSGKDISHEIIDAKREEAIDISKLLENSLRKVKINKR